MWRSVGEPKIEICTGRWVLQMILNWCFARFYSVIFNCNPFFYSYANKDSNFVVLTFFEANMFVSVLPCLSMFYLKRFLSPTRFGQRHPRHTPPPPPNHHGNVRQQFRYGWGRGTTCVFIITTVHTTIIWNKVDVRTQLCQIPTISE